MKYEKSVHRSNLESREFFSPVYIDIQAGLQLLNPWQISIIENYLLIIMSVTYIPLERFGYGEKVVYLDVEKTAQITTYFLQSQTGPFF